MRVVDNVVAVLDANRGELSVLERGMGFLYTLAAADKNKVRLGPQGLALFRGRVCCSVCGVPETVCTASCGTKVCVPMPALGVCVRTLAIRRRGCGWWGG